MSLGVNSEVEDQVTRCIKERGASRAIDVAQWMFDNGTRPILCFGAVAEVMMMMEAKGRLSFKGGRYEVAQEVEE